MKKITSFVLTLLFVTTTIVAQTKQGHTNQNTISDN